MEQTQNLLIHNLLLELAERDVSLRVTNKGRTLIANPASVLTPELIHALKEHKERILKHILDDELEKTDVLQCDRHVVEMAREYFEEAREKTGKEQA